MDPHSNGILTATARRSIRRMSRMNAPYQPRQCLAEAISISFTTDFATCPIESTEEETIQPLHSSTPQPSLQTTNDSMEGSSSSYTTADTVTQISDVTVQGNMIHAPKQFFSQLLSQNHRLAQSKFSLKCKL